jgi:hypothetical protein
MYRIIGNNQAEYGPVTAEQIRQWIAEGRADANTQARIEGSNDWKPLRDFPEFASSFAQPPTPPLSPPPFGGTMDSGRNLALQKVEGPAIGLILTGAFGLLFGLLRILQIAGMFMAWPRHFGSLHGMDGPMWFFSGPVGGVFAMLHIALAAFILYGGIKMRNLEDHGVCLIAAILAIVPCIFPCCCIGLPLGIWALVVLNDSAVKTNFR